MKNTQSIQNTTLELRQMIGNSCIHTDVSMKDYTSFKVGGNADILVEPKNQNELIKVIKYLSALNTKQQDSQIPYIVIGNGSNIIVRDGGFRGVIVVVSQAISGCYFEGTQVKADAGILLSALAKKAADRGLTGMEPVSGIPGSLGGAVFMNAGAYGGEMKDIIKSVNAYDPILNEIETIEVDEMDLSYRHSAFQSNGKIILDVTLSLDKGNPEEIKDAMRKLNEKRNAKQPVNMPSAGSFFKRPEGHYAGGLIEEAGLKGLKKGGAQISELHAGFMVNAGGATASDIEDLMQVVRATVFEKSGVMLEPEVRIIGDSELYL